MPKCGFYDEDMLRLLPKIVMQLKMDLSCNHFDNYSHNYEFATTNMIMTTTIGNYDYK